MIRRLRNMLAKELKQVFRDPRMKGVVFAAPFMQLLLLGYAVSTDVRDIPLAVVDRDRTAQSRDFASRFETSGTFRVQDFSADARGARHAIDRGAAGAVLYIEPGFGSISSSGRQAPVCLAADATDSMTASVVLSHGSAIAGEYAASSGAAGGRGAGPIVELESRAWFNETLESRNFFIPGVMGLLVTLMTLLLTSMAVVREKEIGTLEQIMVTPIRPAEFILGKTLPFALIGFADVLIVLAVGVLWFEVPMRGSLALLFFCMGLYVMTSLGVGLLISTVSRTQQQALMTTFFFFMPAMLLSGFAFPIENMPGPVQAVTYLNPMRYLFVILRGIFLKGAGLDVLWPQILALAAFGVATLTIASRRFRKTIA